MQQIIELARENMLPVNTRPPLRSMSPPSRSEQDAGSVLPTAASPSASKQNTMSIRAAVREYEMVHDELTRANKRARDLRARLAILRSDVEAFMRDRDLEKLGTKDGRLVVRMKTMQVCARPGKRETERCIGETLDEHPDLAQEIIRKLFEEKKQVRTCTTFDKRTPS